MRFKSVCVALLFVSTSHVQASPIANVQDPLRGRMASPNGEMVTNGTIVKGENSLSVDNAKTWLVGHGIRVRRAGSYHDIESAESGWVSLNLRGVDYNTRDRQEGTASVKCKIEGAPGPACEKTIPATMPAVDLSARTELRVWIKASHPTPKDELEIVLKDSAHSAVATLPVPALLRNNWTEVYLVLDPQKLMDVRTITLTVKNAPQLDTVWMDGFQGVNDLVTYVTAVHPRTPPGTGAVFVLNGAAGRTVVGKAKDWNVYHDETEAIQRWIDEVVPINRRNTDYVGHVYIPSGVYWIDCLVLRRGVRLVGEHTFIGNNGSRNKSGYPRGTQLLFHGARPDCHQAISLTFPEHPAIRHSGLSIDGIALYGGGRECKVCDSAEFRDGYLATKRSGVVGIDVRGDPLGGIENVTVGFFEGNGAVSPEKISGTVDEVPDNLGRGIRIQGGVIGWVHNAQVVYNGIGLQIGGPIPDRDLGTKFPDGVTMSVRATAISAEWNDVAIYLAPGANSTRVSGFSVCRDEWGLVEMGTWSTVTNGTFDRCTQLEDPSDLSIGKDSRGLFFSHVRNIQHIDKFIHRTGYALASYLDFSGHAATNSDKRPTRSSPFSGEYQRDVRMECDLRINLNNNGDDEQELIGDFRTEFELKKNVCGVLVVAVAATAPRRWIVAAFNDAGVFGTVPVDDPMDELLVELNDRGTNRDRDKILELATAYIGRTLDEKQNTIMLGAFEVPSNGINLLIGMRYHVGDDDQGSGTYLLSAQNDELPNGEWVELTRIAGRGATVRLDALYTRRRSGSMPPTLKLRLRRTKTKTNRTKDAEVQVTFVDLSAKRDGYRFEPKMTQAQGAAPAAFYIPSAVGTRHSSSKETIPDNCQPETPSPPPCNGPASKHIVPGSSLVEINCKDGDGCNVEIASPMPSVQNGMVVEFVNTSAKTVTFSDAPGMTELAGTFVAGQYDTLTVRYVDERWVESHRSDN